MQRFLQRVWRKDVRPRLADDQRRARTKSARIAGTAAGMSGLALDKLFRLRGKPFTRAFTVLGAGLGALLPDALDWNFLARRDHAAVREATENAARSQAEQLADREALALFNLPPTANREQLRAAWHQNSQRWHPDRARSPAQKCEFHVRFVAYEAAYRRLKEAFETSRLPLTHD